MSHGARAPFDLSSILHLLRVLTMWAFSGRHATSRPRTSTVTKGALEKSFTSALPFVQPESALMEELRNVESVDAINKAVEACLAAGGRKGCPAIVTAEKMIEAAKKDGKVTKAPPAKDPAQGKGWDDASRTLATVHDNSV